MSQRGFRSSHNLFNISDSNVNLALDDGRTIVASTVGNGDGVEAGGQQRGQVQEQQGQLQRQQGWIAMVTAAEAVTVVAGATTMAMVVADNNRKFRGRQQSTKCGRRQR